MKVFLAGTRSCKLIRQKSLYCLDSFFELNTKKNPISDCHQFEDYLLDSGAFTFMSSKQKVALDWNDYVDRLADYVKSNNIQNYFELDIDAVVGYDNVLKLRDRLENRVGWQCIPVWHIERGIEAYEEICKSHKYIAIGGVVHNKSLRKRIKKILPHLLDKAHACGCKVHGLGYTSTKDLKTLHFDSVDSTSWLAFGKYGAAFAVFNGTGFDTFSRPDGCTMVTNDIEAQKVSLNATGYRHYLQGLEWVKYQKYAKENL